MCSFLHNILYVVLCKLFFCGIFLFRISPQLLKYFRGYRGGRGRYRFLATASNSHAVFPLKIAHSTKNKFTWHVTTSSPCDFTWLFSNTPPSPIEPHVINRRFLSMDTAAVMCETIYYSHVMWKYIHIYSAHQNGFRTLTGTLYKQ